MEKIHSIDYMRAVAAFLVVCIHIPFYGEIGSIVIAYGKIAVPFFLVVCGYFCYRTDREEFSKRLKKQIRKIALLTVLANILYLLVDIVLQLIFSSNPIYDIKQLFTSEKWLDFAIYNQSPFADHLWYLGSLLYALIIILLLCRLKLVNYIMFAAPLLLLCYILPLRAGGDMIVWRNCIMVSVPYFMFGCIIRRYQAVFLTRLNKLLIPIIITVLIITNYIEFTIYNSVAPPFISAELLVIAIVLFLLQHPYIGKNTIIEKIGREYSLFIYIFHMSIVALIFRWYASGKICLSFSYIVLLSWYF
ncbi:acyltransferase family protein [Ruminiclostridium cellulolyticum]|uniref:Acyltransferase 3 n=1 Tax=Ruminiclostridium cellulolyticum (strain ATCC 35319 / DSM 5812 / JCM 6584 / H10) TaxID=394503 RepID=B8I6V2_RUMCH|nr:acyltransferase family protein [Ruminiclostridium cellulolyticum]ACL76944.1 acyltransferase 3 [Ruminiclostridium cellulolyticum H10]